MQTQSIRLKFVLISAIASPVRYRSGRGKNKMFLILLICGKKNHFKSKTTVTVKSESVLLILN